MLFLLVLFFFQLPPAQLAIAAPPVPRCVVAQPCRTTLQAAGARPPLRWRIVRGTIPPGLRLDSVAGIVAGAPTAAGVYSFVVEAADASQPPQRAQRSLTITVVSQLFVAWVTAPALTGSTLAGKLRVENNTGDEPMVTVIVVAVNEIGKAFALGYQHFPMRANSSSPDIPFSMSMPPGRYRVRADAVGEVAARNLIYRTSREAGPFLVE